MIGGSLYCTYVLVSLEREISFSLGTLDGGVDLVMRTVADRDGEALGGHIQGEVLALLLLGCVCMCVCMCMWVCEGGGRKV